MVGVLLMVLFCTCNIFFIYLLDWGLQSGCQLQYFYFLTLWIYFRFWLILESYFAFVCWVLLNNVCVILILMLRGLGLRYFELFLFNRWRLIRMSFDFSCFALFLGFEFVIWIFPKLSILEISGRIAHLCDFLLWQLFNLDLMFSVDIFGSYTAIRCGFFLIHFMLVFDRS